MNRHPKKLKAASISNLKKQSGVLLIEVMIAILIFSFGLLGLAGLQATSTQSSVNAEERVRAALHANDLVSRLWAVQSPRNAAANREIANWRNKISSPAQSGLPNATGAVNVAAIGGAAGSGDVVTISITWRSPSKKAGDGDSQYVTSIAMRN